MTGRDKCTFNSLQVPERFYVWCLFSEQIFETVFTCCVIFLVAYRARCAGYTKISNQKKKSYICIKTQINSVRMHEQVVARVQNHGELP